MTRDEALALGLTHYDTGEPCKRGHISPRTATRGTCTACKRLQRARYRESHPEKHRAEKARYQRARYQRNKGQTT